MGFSKQAFYKWKASPVSDRDWADAHLINAALEVYADGPAHGIVFRPAAEERSGPAALIHQAGTASAIVTWIEKTYQPPAPSADPWPPHAHRV
jgi:hypothetical protein